jgi:hypothetical protein
MLAVTSSQELFHDMEPGLVLDLGDIKVHWSFYLVLLWAEVLRDWSLDG